MYYFVYLTIMQISLFYVNDAHFENNDLSTAVPMEPTDSDEFLSLASIFFILWPIISECSYIVIYKLIVRSGRCY